MIPFSTWRDLLTAECRQRRHGPKLYHAPAEMQMTFSMKSSIIGAVPGVEIIPAGNRIPAANKSQAELISGIMFLCSN